jgi:hypothetical protein
MKHPTNGQLLIAMTLLMVLCFACDSIPSKQESAVDPFENIKDQQIAKILKTAFQTHGGFHNWNQKQALKFKKYFALYDEQGQTERSVNQNHHYTYDPEPKIEIGWEAEGKQHLIRQEKGKNVKLVDGQIDGEAKITSLENTIASSTFVMDIPFKLLDPGVQLQYDGTDTLDSETIVDVIRADYDPSKFDNLTTPDIWWYYFDQKDGRLCGYMVKHLDHYSFVRDYSFVEKSGFLFTKERKSYRVDSLRNLLYLRADYAYTDIEVN